MKALHSPEKARRRSRLRGRFLLHHISCRDVLCYRFVGNLWRAATSGKKVKQVQQGKVLEVQRLPWKPPSSGIGETARSLNLQIQYTLTDTNTNY